MIASSSHSAYTRGTGTAVCASARMTRYSRSTARQQMAEGLASENIHICSGDELVGRIGLTARKPLDSDRATEPVDVISHPAFEPTEGQSMTLHKDCYRPARGGLLVADHHLAPHKPALLAADCTYGRRISRSSGRPGGWSPQDALFGRFLLSALRGCYTLSMPLSSPIFTPQAYPVPTIRR